MKPIVAIVGRPNVGKSALFNRIIGARVAIVEDVPGVTRDRIYGDAVWNGREFALIDTGGIEPASDNLILQEMRLQAEIAISMADVILFMTDVRTGVTAADSEVASLLQKAKKPIILCVNFVDTPGSTPPEVYEFYNLGVGEPFPISAAHGSGTGDVLDEIVRNLPIVDALPEENASIKIAVVGKPNAGKSSLINRILGENRLIVSDVPGTTRDSIDTMITIERQEWTLIDTAGMRKRGKVEENIERYSVMRSLTAIERADVVAMMIDGTEGVTEQDTKIAGFAHENGKPMFVCVNKWDIVEKDEKTQSEFAKNIKNKLIFANYAPIIFISAKTGQRVSQVFEMAKMCYDNAGKRVSTSALNEIISESVSRQQPHIDKGKRLKIYYGTQVATNPPQFTLFVNAARLMHFSYQRYLENQIRQTFDFSGTPVKFNLKQKFD